MHFPSRLLPRRVILTVLVFATLAMAGAGPPAQETPEPAEPIDRQIDRLIEQLGDKDYFVRRRAQEELAQFSFEAFDALTAATTHEDLEIAARAKYLLQLLKVAWTDKNDPPEVKTVLKNYEHQDEATKLVRMRTLTGLPDRKGIPALCRLVRFERSPVLSKYAAIELLGPGQHDEPPGKELAEMLRKNLEGSRRSAATWLLTWLRSGDDAEAFITDWTKLVEAEYSLLGHAPTKTSPHIVARLVRLQITALKRLDRKDEAVAAMRRLIDLEKGNPETLAELLDWLVGQKAWQVVDELVGRFAPQFAGNPILLYIVAEAQAQQGDAKRAEETARQALKLNPGNDSNSLRRHYATAAELSDRGRLQWARREYRHVIDSDAPGGFIGALAQSRLAEMLHDQGEDLEAVEVLRTMAKTLQEHPVPQTLARIKTPEIRARMNYFFACHWKNANDQAKRRAYLDKAMEADAADIDVLIACYRLPGQPPDYREKTRRAIEKSAAGLRQQIAGEPTSSTAYNQFAWLVGNTEGDLDEALKCSKRSIELNPNYGGYYDTLAHVYFAKGDYENAVKTQTKAAELEPHSGLIARQLKVFRKKLDESRKEKPREIRH